MKAVLLLLLLLLVAVASVSAYPRFQEEIPNIPIVSGQPWPGVGHTARGGGGSRNAFGMALNAAGYQWTKELCQADSDGDGFTNGQELGDPSCTWMKGQPRPAPANGMSLSHPGLADSVPTMA